MLAASRVRPTPPLPPARAQRTGGEGRGRLSVAGEWVMKARSGDLVADLGLLEVLAREGNEPGLVFHHRGDIDRSLPDPLDIAECVPGVVLPEGYSFEPVPQEELSLVPVVPVRDFDEGEAPVGELK